MCYDLIMLVLLLLLFFTGAAIGSFLNVVIDRVSKGQSIVYPPSHCPYCHHRLAWYDLFPILSYLSLGGKCRYCHRHISFYYLFLELLTGSLFVVVSLFALPVGIAYLLYLLFMTSIFIIIFFTDYKYGIIPVYAIFLGAMIVVTYLIYAFSLSVLLTHVFSAIGAFLLFFILFAATKGRGMGFGDVMLVLLMGLFLGFPYIGIALYLSFLTGALISLILIVTGSKRLKHDTIPFGPFLIFSTFITLFWGQWIFQLVRGYISM
jgi:leader peptidase (prepilin peptidase) / N-methyltransferase